MSLKFNKNNALTLISIVILLIGFFIQNFYISILCTLFFYGAILLSSTSYAIYLVFFSMPLSGIFDDSGFLHFFNFAIIVLFVRLLIQLIVERRLNKNFILVILLVLFLAFYDVFNATINNLLSVGYFNNFSIWIGYLLIAAISFYYELINRQKCLLFLYLGFIVSCALCGFQIYNRWGFDIPSVYRFVGLLRDPNYYSFTAIILLFSSLYVINGKIKYFYAITILLLGLLSVSKMYILLCSVGLILYICYYFYLLSFGKIKGIKYFFLFVILGSLSITILYLTGLIDFIYDKYIYRFETYELTTGRDYIQGQFIDILKSDSQTLLFGRTLDYNKIYKIAYAESDTMLAHNTYLDVLMSFGVFGGFIYIFLLIKIFKLYLRNLKIHGQVIILAILFVLALFALSYLKADNFTVCILLILISAKSKNNYQEGVLNEKDYYVSSDTQTYKLYS